MSIPSPKLHIVVLTLFHFYPLVYRAHSHFQVRDRFRNNDNMNMLDVLLKQPCLAGKSNSAERKQLTAHDECIVSS